MAAATNIAARAPRAGGYREAAETSGHVDARQRQVALDRPLGVTPADRRLLALGRVPWRWRARAAVDALAIFLPVGALGGLLVAGALAGQPAPCGLLLLTAVIALTTAPFGFGHVRAAIRGDCWSAEGSRRP